MQFGVKIQNFKKCKDKKVKSQKVKKYVLF